MVGEKFRSLIRLQTDDGLEGLGETSGTPDIFRLAVRFASSLLGKNPLDWSRLHHEFARTSFHQMNGRNGWIALGGVDMACWDLAGKRFDLPLHDMLGGASRKRIDVACGITAVPLAKNATGDDAIEVMSDLGNVDMIVEEASRRVRRHGFQTIKVKSAAYRTEWDFRVMEALRDTFGRDMKLRIDPNAGYSPATVLPLLKRMDALNLEYYEDPTFGIDGMARLRREVRTSLATNMCVIQFEHLGPAISLGCGRHRPR